MEWFKTNKKEVITSKASDWALQRLEFHFYLSKTWWIKNDWVSCDTDEKPLWIYSFPALWNFQIYFSLRKNAAQFTNRFWCRYSIWQKNTSAGTAIVPCFFSFSSHFIFVWLIFFFGIFSLSLAPLCVDNSVPFSSTPSVWTIWIIDDILSGLISKNLIKRKT